MQKEGQGSEGRICWCFPLYFSCISLVFLLYFSYISLVLILYFSCISFVFPRQRLVEVSLSSGNYSRLLADVIFTRSMGYYMIQV